MTADPMTFVPEWGSLPCREGVHVWDASGRCHCGQWEARVQDGTFLVLGKVPSTD